VVLHADMPCAVVDANRSAGSSNARAPAAEQVEQLLVHAIEHVFACSSI
jgi:hypothetical protein